MFLEIEKENKIKMIKEFMGKEYIWNKNEIRDMMIILFGYCYKIGYWYIKVFLIGVY